MSVAALTLRLGAPAVPPVPSPKQPEGTEKPLYKQSGSLGSLSSPEKQIGQSVPPPLTAADHEAIAEAIEERAAIMEHDGGLPREVAEHEAQTAMRVYRLLIAMGPGEPDRDVVMLAPHCDLAEAAKAARHRFGDARVLDIVEQERSPTPAPAAHHGAASLEPIQPPATGAAAPARTS
jgi:hypothetical protein